jgi:hypothetical protein
VKTGPSRRELTIVWSILLVAILAGGGWWTKHKLTIWYQSLPKRRALASTERASAKEENKRSAVLRIHTHLPDRIIRRMFRWTPESGKRPDVRIAKRGFLRAERVRPDQHIVAIGMTGSGKSSTLRVLGAWALRQEGWFLEAWDAKWGASVKAYKGKCPVLTDIPAIEARLRDLVDRELPLRAAVPTVTHLAIILDESRLLNSLSAAGMADLITVIQTGRELGVHLWFGIQDPKTDSVPSELRDQFSAKLVHMLQTQEAAQVALKELVTAGWHPHKLMRSGQLLVWTPVKGQKPGRVCFGLWLSEADLFAVERKGPFTDPRFAPVVSLVKTTDRPSAARAPIGNARPVGRTDRQESALTVLNALGPLKPAALAKELDVDRRRAAEVLDQLAARQDALKLEDGRYALNTEVRS